MRVLILASFFWGCVGPALAVKTGMALVADDIVGSTQRVSHAFTSKPGKNAITENGAPLGETSYLGEEFYATYRPSLGLEILNCIDKAPLSLQKVGLAPDGHGHQGLTRLFSKEDIEETVVAPFMHYKQETRFPTEQMTLFVEGMSAGAHRAIQTASYLKQHPEMKNQNIVVLRYGDAKTFDDIAVDSIHKLIGKENIFSFHATGDKIVEFMDMPNVTKSLGTRIEFSAAESENYSTRVSSRAYTCMDPMVKGILTSPFVQMFASTVGLNSGMLSFLTPELWELHQPITYAELCPPAFAKFKEKK